jgi:hypothetical protein
MVMRVLGRAVAFGLAMLAARTACAEGAETFRFSWARGDGAGTCPDGSALAARVTERLGRNPFSESALQSIEGNVSRRADGFHAELFVRDGSGVALGNRQLSSTGVDCAELADAVVLAVVLTIDPNAALGGTTAPPSAIVAAPPVAEAPRVAEPPSLGACPVQRCPPQERCPDKPCPPPPHSANASIIGRGLLAVGVLPGVAPGAQVFGELGSKGVRASLGMTYLPESKTDGGLYGFGLTAASVGAVFAWSLGDGLELSALGELEVGAIHAVVYDLEPVDPGDQPWVAGAAGPRLVVSILSPLRLELGASVLVPFIRPSFEARGVSEPAFQSASVGGLGYVGVGLGTP